MSLQSTLAKLPPTNPLQTSILNPSPINWAKAAAEKPATLTQAIREAYSQPVSATCSGAVFLPGGPMIIGRFCGERLKALTALVGANLSSNGVTAWRVALAYALSVETDKTVLYETMRALRARLQRQPTLWGTFPDGFLGLFSSSANPAAYDYDRHPNPLAAAVSAIALGYGPSFPASKAEEVRLAALNLVQDMVSTMGRAMTAGDLAQIVHLSEGTLLDPDEIEMWPWGRNVMNAISSLGRSILAQAQIKIADTIAPAPAPPPPPKLPPTWLQGNLYFYSAVGLVAVMLGGSFLLSKERIARRL